MRKLPARSQFVVVPLLLSLLMSGIVSTVATLYAVGLTPDIGTRILRAWAMSYLIAFPAAVVVLPVVRRIVARIVDLPTPIETPARRG